MENLWVVVLHRLRDVDHPEVALVVEQVVLREVPVDQMAHLWRILKPSGTVLMCQAMGGGHLEHPAHDFDQFQIALLVLFQLELGVFEPGCRVTALADVLHHQDVGTKHDGDWRPDPSLVEPFPSRPGLGLGLRLG